MLRGTSLKNENREQYTYISFTLSFKYEVKFFSCFSYCLFSVDCATHVKNKGCLNDYSWFQFKYLIIT